VQAVTVGEILTRAVAALFALSWFIFPGFGLIDLSVTWSRAWPQALEAGWGLFSTVIVGAAFLLVALRPRLWVPAAFQLALATLALAISAAAAKESLLAWLVVVLALETAIVFGLARRASVRQTEGLLSGPPRQGLLLFLAGVGVGPWLVYALHMWSLNRQGRPVDVTLGVDHYAVQGALALALALLPVLAALRPDLLPFIPACAGVAASYLGLISLAWPHAQGGLTYAWSIAATAWGLALLAVTVFRSVRATPPLPDSRPDLST
jgi:hypothetical protein